MTDLLWWHCTEHGFGWRGDPVPCPLCGHCDNLEPGIAVEPPPDPIEQPFWAFWRKK